MSQKIIFISALLVLPVAAFLLFIFFSDDASETTEAPVQETSGVTELPQGNEELAVEEKPIVPIPVTGPLASGKITITGNDELPYDINGTFSAADVLQIETGFYQLFKAEDPNSEWFDIFYDELSGNIMILLYKEPLREARDKATQVLQERFNATPQLLCNLNINVFTNEYINPEYTGYNLGLSFCPNGVVLP
jgi:hypothetical protein